MAGYLAAYAETELDAETLAQLETAAARLGSVSMKGLITGFGDGKASLSKVVMLTGHMVASAVSVGRHTRGSLNFDFYLTYICASYGANSTNKAISVFGRQAA